MDAGRTYRVAVISRPRDGWMPRDLVLWSRRVISEIKTLESLTEKVCLIDRHVSELLDAQRFVEGDLLESAFCVLDAIHVGWIGFPFTPICGRYGSCDACLIRLPCSEYCASSIFQVLENPEDRFRRRFRFCVVGFSEEDI